MSKDNKNTKQNQTSGGQSKTVNITPGSSLNTTGAFVVKSFNQYLDDAAKRPVQQQLFGEILIEGETAILYGPTNTGKSILAMQIADFVASDFERTIDHEIGIKREGNSRRVLFINFELGERQVFRRYAKYEGQKVVKQYKAPVNLFIGDVGNPDPGPGQNLTEYYFQAIWDLCAVHTPELIIIDNITWLASRLEKSADAGPFMQQLKKLRDDKDLRELRGDKDLTLLIVAHTPKRFNEQPIEVQDIGGSAQIGNFIDSAFAINHSSQGKSMRYIKQTKSRYGEIKYSKESVISCEIMMPDCFLELDLKCLEDEREHLSTLTKEERQDRDHEIYEAYVSSSDGYQKVADKLGVSKSKVQKVVNEFKQEEKANDADIPF